MAAIAVVAIVRYDVRVLCAVCCVCLCHKPMAT